MPRTNESFESDKWVLTHTIHKPTRCIRNSTIQTYRRCETFELYATDL